MPQLHVTKSTYFPCSDCEAENDALLMIMLTGRVPCKVELYITIIRVPKRSSTVFILDSNFGAKKGSGCYTSNVMCW